jgi:hypothetical protein
VSRRRLLLRPTSTSPKCVVLERYGDSEALIEHGTNVRGLMEPILATASVSSEILGEPTAELRAMTTDGPVRLFTPFQSM